MAELIGGLIAISATFVPSLTPVQCALIKTRRSRVRGKHGKVWKRIFGISDWDRIPNARLENRADPLNDKSNRTKLQFVKITCGSNTGL